VGQIASSASLRHLPDAPHRAARRAYPSEPIWSIKRFHMTMKRSNFGKTRTIGILFLIRFTNKARLMVRLHLRVQARIAIT
jgi:hypothetical protein